MVFNFWVWHPVSSGMSL